MKLKYYLRGIGIGMIVTTIILMITFAVRGNQPLTDEEICERAAELGMIMAEDLPVRNTLADTDPADQGEAGKEGSGDDTQAEPQSTKDAKDAAGADSQGADDAQEQDKDNDKKDDRTQPDVVEQIEITIVGGEYSNDVCKKLKRAGLIEDIDDFNKYLSDGGYDNLIQPGNYVIPLGSDYDEIVKIITERER